jgi:hypothetical protein
VGERHAKLLRHAVHNRPSSNAFGFLRRAALLQRSLHVGDHFASGIEGTVGAAFLKIFFGLSQAGVDESPLRRGVFVISSWEFGAVDDHFRRYDDLAPLVRKLYQIALGQTGLFADARG